MSSTLPPIPPPEDRPSGHFKGGVPSIAPKSGESGTVRRELDQIARQLKGLSDRVKRLKDTA